MAEHADHDYVHGSMDISEQRWTFALFWALTKWGSIFMGVALVLLFLTRTNAVDCSKQDAAEQYINSCGKLVRDGAENLPAPAPEH